MIRDSLLHEQARLLVQKFSHTQKRDTDIGTGEKCAQSAQVSIEGKSRGFSPDMEDLSKSPKSDMHDSSNIVVTTDKDRLKAGLELRTTLMIKKVPRKYTLEILRREIDHVLSASGAYDLLYLPVDSAKMTNRGYAFINFTSAKHVEAFVKEFLNRQWSELNRRGKAAGLHWAYVQGRDETLSHIKTEVMDK